MAKQQSPEQHAEFQRLCRDNGLDPQFDVWKQKQSEQWIIGRTGIEKIQARNHISVTLEVVGFGLDYAGVKATATRSVKEEGARTAKKLTVESLGSAHPKNCLRISYYLEMAEKRAKSRAVLMLMGFYALGVYGEDEADDFREPAPAEAAPAPAQPTTPAPPAAPTESPAKPVAGSAPAASASPSPAVSTMSGPSVIPAEVLTKFEQQFAAATSLEHVGRLWAPLTKPEKAALWDAKEAAKARFTEPAPSAPVVREEPVALKDAGTDTALVDEFEVAVGTVSKLAPATAEQKQQIQRFLNHPLITRKEKTKLLLNINRLDTVQARAALGKLRAAIDERERYQPTEADQRAQLGILLQQEGQYLSEQQAADLRTLLADETSTLAVLTEALDAARDAVLDAQVDDATYGTEAELAEAEAAY